MTVREYTAAIKGWDAPNIDQKIIDQSVCWWFYYQIDYSQVLVMIRFSNALYIMLPTLFESLCRPTQRRLQFVWTNVVVLNNIEYLET